MSVGLHKIIFLSMAFHPHSFHYSLRVRARKRFLICTDCYKLVQYVTSEAFVNLAECFTRYASYIGVSFHCFQSDAQFWKTLYSIKLHVDQFVYIEREIITSSKGQLILIVWMQHVLY